MLADERERQGLSRADIAQRLHMSAWQVEALETGDYARLPKGTFLRGFVRNFTKALGLEPDALLSMLAEDRPRDPAPGIVVPTQNIRFDPLGERLSSPYVKASAYAVVAVAIGFAGMYWWMYVRPASPAAIAQHEAATAASAPAAPTRAEPAPGVPETAATAVEAPHKSAEPPKAASAKADASRVEPAKIEGSRNDAAKAASAKGEPAKAEAARSESARSAVARPELVEPDASRAEPMRAQPVSALKGAEKNLRFRFKGASWVEVRDGRGRVLQQGLNAPGTEIEVKGRPPLSIVVGNAPEVQMYMNDQAFDLDPHTKVAVARFTVE